MVEKDQKNKFWKGVLVGGLVTAFLGLLIVGVATGISIIGGIIMQENQLVQQQSPVPDSQTVGSEDVEAEISKELDFDQIEAKMKSIQKLIDEDYLFPDKIEDMEEVEEWFYSIMMMALGDPYSVYYSTEDFTSLMEEMEGEYCGIGAMLMQDYTTGIHTIVKVFPGFPAEEAGLLPGDIIYKVSDVEVTGMDATILVNQYVKGMEGTVVRMTVLREGEYVDLKIIRDQIEVPSIEYEMLEDDIGYIYIMQFDLPTAGQFIKAIEDLESQGMKGLVIDLRGNPGGILDAVVEIAAYVLPDDQHDGMILYTEDINQKGMQCFSQDGMTQITTNDGSWPNSNFPIEDNHELDLPITVLVNGSSASAAEVFAGCMKDYNWATLVGTTTFGKGIVQAVIPLGDGSAVKLTTAHYFTPAGFNIHEIGIEPDILVELDEGLETQVVIEQEEDNQLQAAIKQLKEELDED